MKPESKSEKRGTTTIIFVTIESKMEAESRGPLVVPLSDKRVAILLGAAEWVSPDTGAAPVRLEEELPKIIRGVAGPKRLQQEQENDLEELGMGFLEPLRKAASRLHNKVSLAKDEPLVELLLVAWQDGYGPEFWSMRYRMAQDPLRGEYWNTRVLRPAYNQHYPPEKGQPRTLMEVAYPPAGGDRALLDLLKAGEPKLASLLNNRNEPAGRAWAAVQAGESHKAKADDLLALVRAAVNATVPAETTVSIAIIRELATRERAAFEWIVAPAEPSRTQRAEEEEKREPGAPTLRKKPPTKD
jgi:hypothetical protein